MSKFTKILKAVADPSREKILLVLREHDEMGVNDIAKTLQLAQPTASRHLRILAEAGAVTSRRDKQEVLYSICSKELCDIISEFVTKFKKYEEKEG